MIRTLLFFLFVHLPLFSANLHLIAVMDTQASRIGISVETNLATLIEESRRISDMTDLKPIFHLFTNEDAVHSFVDTLTSMEVGEEDVILFHWSGHGFRTASKDRDNNPWPSFQFTNSEQSVDHLDITHYLLKKRARLVISIADTCNEYLDESYAPYEYLEPFPRSALNLERAYRKLFLDYRGLIMAAGSAPGGYSYYWVPNGGGIFTQSWLASMETNASLLGEDVSWEHVFETTLQLVEAVDYQNTKPQVPMVEMMLRQRTKSELK